MNHEDVAIALADAQREREVLLERQIERAIDVALAAESGKPGTNFKQVSPAAKKKLRGLMRFYAKKPHPFRACVADNTKRFGHERAEKVCAVLKDLIKNTTKWRKGHKMSEDILFADENFEIDEELADLIVSLPDETIALMMEALVADDD